MGVFTNSTYTSTIHSIIAATESKINNPYYKFTEKKPTPCTYWKQNREKSTLDESTATNYSHVGEDSPIRFNQINNFYIYGFDKITLDYDLTDFGLESAEIAGEVVVLPNTIIPLPGDFFKVSSIKEDVLFKVNKVTPDTLDNGANFYKIEYKLELVNQYENILKQVVAEYEFIIENVGTDFSCFITSTNYDLAKELNVPIIMFKTDVFKVANTLNKEAPCYMCARMRRGHLYSKAKELGCNKIALGHHFDDVIETILLSVLYGGEFKTMMPKVHSDNFEGMELIRPMYLVKERDIIAWTKYNNLKFINCACEFTKKNKIKSGTSKREVVKKIIDELRRDNKYVEYNIFKSAEKVNLNTIISYQNDAIEKHFLDEYDKQ